MRGEEYTGFNVENPIREKPREYKTPTITIIRECTMASCKATTLSSLSSPQAAVIHRGVDLFLSCSLSLSLSHGCSLFTPLKWKNRKMRSNNNKTVCPKSYLYTYDFWANYICSLEGSWQTYSQICPRIRICLRVHPSSGSEAGIFNIRIRNRVCIIQFRYRVLFVRVFIPDSRTSDHPIRKGP